MDAPSVLAQAEQGTLGRGEQDLLVRFERQLPGFGGFYIENGAVRVYMKTGSIPPAIVRSVLSKVYVAHPNSRVRTAMADVINATIIQGAYTLSELIAIQKRIEESIPGWSGVGTNIVANRVVVLFSDSAAMISGLGAMELAGVPAGALTSLVIPAFRATVVNFSQMTRPVRGGLPIFLGNETYEPHTMKNLDGRWVPYWHGSPCSLGFNVNVGSSGDYFMTASHCENSWRGANGAIGDSVFQPARYDAPAPSGLMGVISWNVYWTTGVNCPFSDVSTGARFDFCTTADVALGQYVNGASGERKIAVSKYGGVNGDPGTDAINNWYPINAVLSPEYVDVTMHHQGNKSAGYTYTTSGPFVSE